MGIWFHRLAGRRSAAVRLWRISSSFSPRLGYSVSRCKEEPESPRYVAIKIGTCTYGSTTAAEHELTLSEHIARANPLHPGASYIRTPINNFQLRGSYGTHICLVYRPMRETLYDFRCRFRNKRFPPQILKLYVALLLQGLNYLHSECFLIHTGKSLITKRKVISLLALKS